MSFPIVKPLVLYLMNEFVYIVFFSSKYDDLSTTKQNEKHKKRKKKKKICYISSKCGLKKCEEE